MKFNSRLKIILFLSLFFLAGCASQAERKAATSTSDKFDFPVLDAHMHFNKTDTERNQPNADMTKELEGAGVIGGVVHLEKGEWKQVTVNRQSKFKFAICAAIVPGETVERIEKEIKAGVYQCMKVYLGYVPKYATDGFYHPFYKLADKYKLPVVFHTGDTYDKNALVKYADPLPIDEVAVKYPKVNFVIAHMGNPWIQSAAEVVYKNDNVYADASAFMLGDVSKRDAEIVDELVVKPVRWFFIYVDNPKKIMFGSDWSLLNIGPYIEAVKKAIPKEHWKAVFYENTARVFNLGGVTQNAEKHSR